MGGQKGRYLRPAPQPPQPTWHTQRTTSSDPLFHQGETRRVVCVCVRADDRFHCRTSWLLCRGSASCDRPTAQNPRVLGNFSRKNHFTQDLSPLTERASCHTNRQKSSTAMRVVSRAGDSEARPLQRY